MQPFETFDAPANPPRAAAGSRESRLLAGLTARQVGRLTNLRARVRRGDYAADGAGAVDGSLLSDRRLAFARWLVQTGRLHEGAG